VISFFRKKDDSIKQLIKTDMHSHLLAGLDDGVKSHEEAVQLINNFYRLGYRKVITTPHIMSDYYRNEPEEILSKTDELNIILQENEIPVIVEAAAEYYLDENLMSKLNAQEKLLTFGDHYLLFETNFFSEPYHLNDFIFNAITQGYKPVLAHPERYQFMSMEKAEELRNRGVLLQLNIPSLVGYYGKPIERMAVKLIEAGWVDLLGSDCHNLLQCKALEEAFQNKNFKKALALPLLNNSL
jgi:tyrosine-protein phosphatase YwqE